MNERGNDEESARRYLLGQLSEPEQIAIDDRLLLDDAYFQRLEMIEDELIDDYISGTLSESDRQAFSSHFLAAPERRKKLEFALNMHQYARDHQPTGEAPISGTRWKRRQAPRPGPRTSFASSPYFW